MVGIQSYISKAKKDLGYSDIDTGSSSTKKQKKFKNRDGKDFVPTRKKVSMGKITTMKKGGIVKMRGGGAATRGMNFNRGR